MEIPRDEGAVVYIANLQLISPERAAQLGIESNAPVFVSHRANIRFDQLIEGLHQVDVSPFRLELNKPMSAREWILEKGVLDNSRVSWNAVAVPGRMSGRWIAIVEEEEEWWKQKRIRAKEIRAYCWDENYGFQHDVRRLDRGYLLYEPVNPGSVYKAGAYAPVCDFRNHRGMSLPSDRFSIDNGQVIFDLIA